MKSIDTTNRLKKTGRISQKDFNDYLENMKGLSLDLRLHDLRGLDMSNLDLSGALFGGSNLRGANLSNSNLCDANLSYANLCDTILDNTIFSNTYLHATDFSLDIYDHKLFKQFKVGYFMHERNDEEMGIKLVTFIERSKKEELLSTVEEAESRI